MNKDALKIDLINVQMVPEPENVQLKIPFSFRENQFKETCSYIEIKRQP